MHKVLLLLVFFVPILSNNIEAADSSALSWRHPVVRSAKQKKAKLATRSRRQKDKQISQLEHLRIEFDNLKFLSYKHGIDFACLCESYASCKRHNPTLDFFYTDRNQRTLLAAAEIRTWARGFRNVYEKN